MTARLGTTQISRIFRESTAIASVYRGSTLVWERSEHWADSERRVGTWTGSTPAAMGTFNTWLGRSVGLVVSNFNDSSTSALSSDIPWAIGQHDTTEIPVPVVWGVPLATGNGDGSAGNISLAQAASGSLDTIWASIISGVSTNRAGMGDIFRPGWEFNGNWFGWYSTGKTADYITAFRRFVTMARATFGSNGTAFDWCHSFDATTTNPEASYPGDDYVDFVGFDFYWNSPDWGNDAAGFWAYAQNTADYTINEVKAFATAHGKRLSVAEWGFNHDNAATILDDWCDWLNTNAAFHGYWNTNEAFTGKLSDDQFPNMSVVYKKYFGPPVVSTGSSTVASGEAGSLDLACASDGIYPVTWSIVGGADAASFSLAGNTLSWGALADATREVTVRATVADNWGAQLTSDKTLSLTFETFTAITRTFIGALTPKTTSASSFTWSGEDIGAADAARYVIVTLNYRAAGTPTVTSVTIGGVTATLTGHVNTSDSSTSGTLIAVAAVPTGTTADIVATFSGSIARVGGGKIRALNLVSATPNDTATASTGGNGDPSVTIDKYAGGIVVASQYYCQSASPEQRSSGASIETTSAEAGATVSATNDGANATWSGVTEDYDQQLTTGSYAPQALVVASWSP